MKRRDQKNIKHDFPPTDPPVPAGGLIQQHCAAAESLNSLYKRELIDFEKGREDVSDVMLATMDWVS